MRVSYKGDGHYILRKVIIQRRPCLLDIDGKGPVFAMYIPYADTDAEDIVRLPGYPFKKDEVTGMTYMMASLDVGNGGVTKDLKKLGIDICDCGMWSIPEVNIKFRSGIMPLFYFKCEAVSYICKMTDNWKEYNMKDNVNRGYVDYSSKKAVREYYSNDNKALGINKVIFNDPATVVFWSDGTKTVVRASEESGDKFDPLTGISMALMRKVYGKNYRKIEKFATEYNKKLEGSYAEDETKTPEDILNETTD